MAEEAATKQTVAAMSSKVAGGFGEPPVVANGDASEGAIATTRNCGA